LGPMPKRTEGRIANAVRSEWAEGLITSWLGADWVNAPKRVGDKLARLIGAGDDEVVVADSTSINIFKALAAATSINSDRTVILSETGNFPTDLYMMQGFESFSSGRIKLCTADYDDVLDVLDDSVAV